MKQIAIDSSSDARKERIDADAAWEMLKSATRILTAKGKKVQEWNPQADTKDAILKAAMGPSGNLRAPTLRIGETFYIGFNADMYENELSR